MSDQSTTSDPDLTPEQLDLLRAMVDAHEQALASPEPARSAPESYWFVESRARSRIYNDFLPEGYIDAAIEDHVALSNAEVIYSDDKRRHLIKAVDPERCKQSIDVGWCYQVTDEGIGFVKRHRG